ncbi:hypothetical protein BDV36DRAFT_251129 [Aspergillus pseudocaelatus]|uniref:Uncharacterized protein n=1 Tax=Aspergillus pseudocaelatus TaxID=1825620 RepID=A0ABQ6WQW5_9EURO|nr:hypothetical protein BDV36DRAFT_251129 [Aspergillus pseudocaelatus]
MMANSGGIGPANPCIGTSPRSLLSWQLSFVYYPICLVLLRMLTRGKMPRVLRLTKHCPNILVPSSSICNLIASSAQERRKSDQSRCYRNPRR